MAYIFRNRKPALSFGWIIVLWLAWLAPSQAQEAPPTPSALHDRPTLVLDPGMHTGNIRQADVDTEERYVVTGSEDKTVRVWSVTDGRLLRTIRIPSGPGNVGKIYAVAISPDGKLIATGGWTQGNLEQEQIYVFDRATGKLLQRIEGLPNVVHHLTFSPDGRYLVATLHGRNGLRVYKREAGFAEIARDSDYGSDSYGADFAADGRLATSSYDGKIRLYDSNFKRTAVKKAPGGPNPFGVAFSPDGSKLAVGYYPTNETEVDLLDGQSLETLPGPDTRGLNGFLNAVTWSQDGATLFAGGAYSSGNEMRPFVAWSDAGLGRRRELPAGSNTIMALLPLAHGNLLIATQDPYLALLNAEGKDLWTQKPPQADFRGKKGQMDHLAISEDGSVVDFAYKSGGKMPARFDLGKLRLSLGPQNNGRTTAPKFDDLRDGLKVTNWEDNRRPMLDGVRLPLQPYETSRSLTIHPDGQRFVLGAEWSLRAFSASGGQLWEKSVPGSAWAVNISGDGRLVVAAYGDGTIRWYDMKDGREILAFFPLKDQSNWVAWSPEGFYAATRRAREVLRWHINHGLDAPAEAIPVSEIAELHRPEVLPLVLREMDIVRALGLAELVKARKAVQVRTNSSIPPGSQLHVLAIGVGEYNDQAKHLRLNYADDDAHDVASALDNTQTSLYTRVFPQVLRNDEATKAGIFRALATMQGQMQVGGNDVAVIHFSGHGALLDDKLYLLPYEVDARDPVGIRATAIEISVLRSELLKLAEKGRVLVLLDACRSGAATVSGASMTVDSRALRGVLAGSNITVLTSSLGSEPSREDKLWENGAFTEVFLKALGRQADSDQNGVISMTELTHYLTTGVPGLTEGKQTPGLEVRFERTIFAAGL